MKKKIFENILLYGGKSVAIAEEWFDDCDFDVYEVAEEYGYAVKVVDKPEGPVYKFTRIKESPKLVIYEEPMPDNKKDRRVILAIILMILIGIIISIGITKYVNRYSNAVAEEYDYSSVETLSGQTEDFESYSKKQCHTSSIAVSSVAPTTKGVCGFDSRVYIKNQDKLPLSPEFLAFIKSKCVKYNVPAELVVAVMETESNFDNSKVSNTNDYGIMQINSNNFNYLQRELGLPNCTDLYNNTECGIYMLSELYKQYKEYHLAAMAYNMGEAGAKELWEQGIYSTEYSDKVLSNMRGE